MFLKSVSTNSLRLVASACCALSLSACQTAAPQPSVPASSATAAGENSRAITPAPPANSTPLLQNIDFKLWVAQGTIQCAAQWVCSQHAGPISYKFSHDKLVTKSGSGSASVERTGPEDWGTMWQDLNYLAIAGRKIRVSADVRRASVVGKGGGLSFVSSGGGFTEQSPIVDKFIEGTNDWQREELVISLPRTTSYARVGFSLEGSGKIWVDNFKVEILAN